MTEEKLSNGVVRKINHLCDKADAMMDDFDFQNAIKTYQQALDLLPEPYIEWEISTYIVVSQADAYFYLGDFAKVAELMDIALITPDGLANPLVQLRLGQAFLELGNPEKARTHLQKAYDMEGKEIFEDDDAKYWEFLETAS